MQTFEGVVVKTTGNIITVQTGNERIFCRVKGSFRIKDINSTNPVAVGDYVKYYFEGGDALITELLERNKEIIRK